jgi:hypothetical protein
MSYTYTWTDAEQTSLKREDTDGNIAFVPADPANRDYAEFLSSGDTAADYVAPPAPKALTTEEKVNHLLSDYGLTRAELLTALEAKPAVQEAKTASTQPLDSGWEQFKDMDVRMMLDFARAHSIQVPQEFLSDEDGLRHYLAASMNAQSMNT